MSDPQPPIFHDPKGRRWPRLRGGFYVLSVLFAALLIAFVASILCNPFLPRFKLPQTRALPRNTSVRPPPLAPPVPVLPPLLRHAVTELHRAEKSAPVRKGRRPQLLKLAPPPKAPPPRVTGRPLAAAFYVNWDDSSYASLRRNVGQLDWFIPEWARLSPDGTDGPLRVELDLRALDLVRRERPQAHILPLLQNFHDGAWDGPLVQRVLGSDATRAALLRSLLDLLSRQGFGGVVVDFEEVDAESQPALLRFLAEMHAAFALHGWQLGEAVPFDDDDWAYPAHAAVTDYLFLMAYDQHSAESPPGPVAAQGWFERLLEARLQQLDPAHVMVCLGGYGYDWTLGPPNLKKTAQVVSFQESLRVAHDSEAPVRFDPDSKNPTVSYQDEDGARHQVWFLDAVTAYNEMQAASGRVAGFALWRLGGEDPSLWQVFGAADKAPPKEGAQEITFPYDVEFDGTGELLQVGAEPRPGRRELSLRTVGPAVFINNERYLELPSSYMIRRSGDSPGLISLTFDDGPDRRYTPAILDILRREGVKATFFIIGEEGAREPGLLRRIVEEGHDLGNHTYTHPNLGEATPLVTDLELNATQRLIEAVTGRATTLFRPPYFGDAEPQTPDEVAPLVQAQHLGYVTIGVRIDSNDWALPGADAMLRTVMTLAARDPDERGNVVLLHDGGGDRSQTVAALPGIIAGLRQQGLRLVPVSQLAGLTQDQAMPKVTQAERFFEVSDTLFFRAVSASAWAIRWIFVLGLFLGLLRILFITVLAFIQRFGGRGRKTEAAAAAAASSARPLVSVLVPAYNEEKVILRTIESLLGSTYPEFEILVIDDGSKDGTYKVVKERFGNEPRVRAFTKPNSGKAESLNFGLTQARGEIIVGLDADTLFPPEVLGELVRPFADPRVGAVAGNAKVGNRINLVTRWQAMEYISSQNLDRRAFDLLNCITVVPGAVGAWRRSVLAELGGFASETLAEDQDLTLKVRRRGYRIAYAEKAIAYTEAPDTLRALAKQRFRWSFGTLQCMWKHRDALLRPRYGALGFFAMPNVWIFQILFPLFAPLVDLLLLGALGWALLERIEHPAAHALSQLQPVLFYYAFFLAVDWLSAALSFFLERGEQKSLLFWFVLQRVCYRQIMYYVMLKSVYAALRGGLVGWGQLERKATVTHPR